MWPGAVAAIHFYEEPCIVISSCGKGAGVYLQHAMTLVQLRSLSVLEGVMCICVNALGTKLLFGTHSGLFCLMNSGFELRPFNC